MSLDSFLDAPVKTVERPKESLLGVVNLVELTAKVEVTLQKIQKAEEVSVEEAADIVVLFRYRREKAQEQVVQKAVAVKAKAEKKPKKAPPKTKAQKQEELAKEGRALLEKMFSPK